MIAEDIEIAIAKEWGIRANLIIPNASWGAGIHECDLLILSKSGYLTEIEIKISKSDLVKDLKKYHGHRSEKIKYLYFAIPYTLYQKGWKNNIPDVGTVNYIENLIPKNAGIITVCKDNYYRYIVKTVREPIANALAKPVQENEKYGLARLGALRIWDLKKRLQKVREAMK